MKKVLLSLSAAMMAATMTAQHASQTFITTGNTDRTIFFATDDEGEDKTILWGLDTAWPNEGNIRRGVRFIGAENIGVARVSFQPWDFLGASTTLTDRLEQNLRERLRLVSLIGGPDKLKLVLNNDAPSDVYDTRYSNPSANAEALQAYCNLIYATTLSCQEKGWEVITASPLNEPDYQWNGQGSQEDFLAIARKLKTEYPQYKDGSIRISGGNTLNCDQALTWYNFLSEYIDEGNTHQLAGDFNHYADFFTKVRADGKYATADELHNVMEAMVGVEYGMQTGIWWGTAERARGEFCKASFGRRLAYVENRTAWGSAAVYRNREGQVQGFVGCSERQALPCSYRFVSTDRDVFYNGHGPQREFVVEMPGDEGYQTPEQRNAECVVDITWGEDVSPVIDGTYLIMNKHSKKVMSFNGSPVNLSSLAQKAPVAGNATLWEVKPVPNTIGGDFSYHSLCLASNLDMKADILNWSLEEKGSIILYNGAMGGNEQWYLKYAGDGYFRIFSRHSNLCLELSQESTADGITVHQASPSGSDRQLWRFLPENAPCETTAPDAPSGLTATPLPAAVALGWTASPSSDTESYTILRAEAGSDEYTTVGRNIRATTFTDNTVETGRQYTYKVKAVDRSLNTSAATSAVNCTPTGEKALIAHLTFNATLTDATGHHFDATVAEGTEPEYTDGRTAGTSALRFSDNASTEMNMQLPYRLVRHESVTLATWINWETRGSMQNIFDFGMDIDHHFLLSLNSAGKMTLQMKNGDLRRTLDAGIFPTGEWKHVAVTIAPERVAVFIDGVLAAEAKEGFGVTLNDIKPAFSYLGRNLAATSRPLKAALQDFRVYNHAVDDAMIPSIMTDDTGALDNTLIPDAEVVATEYYNLLGVRVENPSGGIFIIRHIYADGTVTTTKRMIP